MQSASVPQKKLKRTWFQVRKADHPMAAVSPKKRLKCRHAGHRRPREAADAAANDFFEGTGIDAKHRNIVPDADLRIADAGDETETDEDIEEKQSERGRITDRRHLKLVSPIDPIEPPIVQNEETIKELGAAETAEIPDGIAVAASEKARLKIFLDQVAEHYPMLYVARSRIDGAGLGVYSQENLNVDDVIAEYKGQLFDKQSTNILYGARFGAPYATNCVQRGEPLPSGSGKVATTSYIIDAAIPDLNNPKTFSVARFINDANAQQYLADHEALMREEKKGRAGGARVKGMKDVQALQKRYKAARRTQACLEEKNGKIRENNVKFVDIGFRIFVVVTKPIPAQSEIYVDYGENYWYDKEHPEYRDQEVLLEYLARHYSSFQPLKASKDDERVVLYDDLSLALGWEESRLNKARKGLEEEGLVESRHATVVKGKCENGVNRRYRRCGRSGIKTETCGQGKRCNAIRLSIPRWKNVHNPKTGKSRSLRPSAATVIITRRIRLFQVQKWFEALYLGRLNPFAPPLPPLPECP